jgi:hypothetical protein
MMGMPAEVSCIFRWMEVDFAVAKGLVWDVHRESAAERAGLPRISAIIDSP